MKTEKFASPKYVVAIGASAGGLEAFQKILQNLPTDLDYSFVVLSHLDPHHKSMLSEILSKHTKMQVIEIVDDTRLNTNCVYVLPPNRYLFVKDKTLYLTEPKEPRGFRLPIDFFFESLAHDLSNNAVAVVLSGTGSDGSKGIKTIVECGGLVIVQEPQTARFDSMPQNVMSTGLPHIVLSPEEIGRELRNLVARHALTSQNNDKCDSSLMSQDERALDEILEIVQHHSKQDFSAYKRATLLRRIQRRMSKHDILSLASFRKFLQEHPEEASVLFDDLLINVTHFFRDPDAFQRLSELCIEPLLKNKKTQDEFRIWVPACASGEEAYTLAILVLEIQEKLSIRRSVKIFATDIDSHALELGRRGAYSSEIEAHVSEERLSKFFFRDNNVYRVSKRLREMVLFAPHDLVADPAYSRLDLISCRNVFIYFEPVLQRKTLETFAYGLNMGGFLFLGSSENVVEGSPVLFTDVDKAWRIFKKVGNPNRSSPQFTNSPRKSVSSFFPESTYRRLSVTSDVVAQMESELRKKYLPPTVLLNPQNEVMHFVGDTSLFIKPAEGQSSLEIYRLVRDEMKIELRAALFKLDSQNLEEVRFEVRLKNGAHDDVVTFFLKKIAQSEYRSLTLESIRSVVKEVAAANQESIATQLAMELEHANEHLRQVIEEHDLSTQELRAANEELMSMNEELQSTTEELETSKEELQSINEELETVNAELQVKLVEFTKTNNDLNNTLTSSNIAQIFLDKRLCLRRYTPAATQLFNLLPADVGRPISHVSARFDYKAVATQISRLTKEQDLIELHVQTEDDKIFNLRAIPYRTDDLKIDGVVLTFFDITKAINFERTAQEAEARSKALLSAIPDALFRVNTDLMLLDARAGQSDLLKFKSTAVVGKKISELSTQLDGLLPQILKHIGDRIHETIKKRELLEALVSATQVSGQQGVEERHFEIRMIALTDDDVMAMVRDVTDKLRAEKAERSVQEAENAVKMKAKFLANVSHELRTPLNAIIGFTSVLKSDFNNPLHPEHAEFVDDIEASGNLLLSQVNQLLDLSKAEAGKLEVHISRGKLKRVFGDLDAVFGALMRKVNQELKFRADGIVESELALDFEKVLQVLTNLVSNAHKFTKQGGTIEVSAKLVNDGTYLRFEVRDSGVGIPAGELKELFQPYHQLSNVNSARSKGTGLGLSLAKTLVEILGGSIGATVPGVGNQGSCFYFTVPLGNRE